MTLRAVRLIETESRKVISRGRGRKEWAFYNGSRVSVLQNEEVLDNNVSVPNATEL